MIELFQSVESQDAVFVGHRHDVGCNADGAEIEQWDESREGDAVVFGKGLHQFEPYTASAEVLEWVGVIGTFRIKDGDGRRQLLVRHVMVADDEVDAHLFGPCDLLVGFNAAVEDNNQLHASLAGVLQSFVAYSIAFIVTVRNVIVDVGVELLQKFVDQCYCRATVYVVVAVDENLFFAPHGVVQSVDGHVHVLHQERIDEVGQLWAEKSLGCTLGCDASPQEQQRQHWPDA